MPKLTARNDMFWLIDLDGVVWLGDQPIPGASEAFTALVGSGRTIAFFTNNSFTTSTEMHERLAQLMGAHEFVLLSSAQASARLLQPGDRAYVLGGDGINEALLARGVEVVPDDDDASANCDAVLVGLDRRLSYERLARAARAVHSGARLIGTNEDPTFPTSNGLLPGGGAMLAAVSIASGREPLVAGKPHEPAVGLVRERLGSIEVVVGDRPSTDGLFAKRLGVPFALVRSGVTKKAEPVKGKTPDFDAPDLKTLVEQALG